MIMCRELTDKEIDAVFDAQEEKYGQVCDAEDMRMFVRACFKAAQVQQTQERDPDVHS